MSVWVNVGGRKRGGAHHQHAFAHAVVDDLGALLEHVRVLLGLGVRARRHLNQSVPAMQPCLELSGESTQISCPTFGYERGRAECAEHSFSFFFSF